MSVIAYVVRRAGKEVGNPSISGNDARHITCTWAHVSYGCLVLERVDTPGTTWFYPLETLWEFSITNPPGDDAPAPGE